MLGRLESLGIVGWILVAMVSAVLVLTAITVALRARAQRTAAERKAALALIAIAVGMPVVGLLGTVVGLISAFEGVSNVNPADKSTILAAGISEAMNCTVAGFVLAVPALAVGVLGLVSSSGRVKKAGLG